MIMDNCIGEILLVGEGDFSFTLAFAKKAKNSNHKLYTTSTSLLKQEELFSIHKAAQQNVEMIKSLGVKVLIEVDATKLEDHECLKMQKFDRIIFNFPHIGGKSNIKKNRELLKDFFKSAVRLLNEEGEILLSLCRGQGGVPIDNPVRAWHDSWQAVTMAAYMDLILFQVTVFDPDDWPEYSCTGFRSRDQHFYTGGAFTYFFKQAHTVHAFDGEDVEAPVKCTVDGEVVHINRYIAHKLNRDLLQVKQHPLQCVAAELRDCFSDVFGKEKFLDLEYLPQKIISTKFHWKKIQETTKADRDPMPNDNSGDTRSVAVDQNCINDNSSFNVDYIEGMRKCSICPYYHVTKCDSSDVLKLRTTLLNCGTLLENFVQSDRIVSAYGDVYRRTWPSADDLPVQHEYVVLIPGGYSSQFSDPKAMLQMKVCAALNCILENEEVRTTVCDLKTLPAWYREYMEDIQCIEVGYKSENLFHKTACNQVGSKGAPSFENQQKGCKVAKLSKIVGYIGKLNLNALALLQNTEIKQATVVVVNIDAITQIRYDIPSQSLLWSEDPNFLNQFKNSSRNNDQNDILFTPLSYYPPLWRHDLSFWEKQDEVFDEQRFIDIVRNISGDSLSEVILMNVWRDPLTNKISKCYREVYQCFDAAVSHSKAHEFQNTVRLRASQVLGVELR